MSRIFIYYNFNDLDDDGSPYIDANDVPTDYISHGFTLHQPVNANDFLEIIENLPIEDTILHIHAHGNGQVLAPLANGNQESAIVNYDELAIRLQRIYPQHQLIINMMAVCFSATRHIIPSTIFMGTRVENNDLPESFEIYQPDGNYTKGLERLNHRNHIYTMYRNEF